MEDLVSVIVPAYNADKVIKRCIMSIILQDYKTKEIIIINDGSKDTTQEICENFAKQHLNISVYNIENQGVSNARNIGIFHAKGKWIMFVDADDELQIDCITEALKTLKQNSADTVCFNSLYIDNGGISTPMSCIYPEKIFQSEGDRISLIESLYMKKDNINTGDYFRAVWGKLLSADIIKKYRLMFPVNVSIGEDAIFLIKYISHAKKIFLSNQYLHKYYRTFTSATGSYKEKFYNYQKLEFVEMMRALECNTIASAQIAIEFWHRAEKEFIENEFKSHSPVKKRISVIANYLKEEYPQKYLVQFNNNKIRPRIRGMLEKQQCFYLLALIDYYILYLKKN